MEISAERRDGGVTVVRPEGRLDLLSAAELKRLLVEEVGAGQHRLVVDLMGVTFIDSSGLGALIGGLKAARTAGGNLRLARAGEQALTILELTTLDRVLRPYPTVEAALAAA
jgi:anti-sigma B factor antagonist